MTDLFGHAAIATQPPDALPEGERRERDAYYTPDALARACCATLLDLGARPQSILEPGCGGGAFLRAFERAWPKARLLGVDIAPACSGPGEVRTVDLFSPEVPGAFDAAIGNPPFDLAERFVRRSLELVVPLGYVAFLLRLGFLASQERMALFRECPLYAFQAIPQRPSFTGGGTDRYDYALFIWRKGYSGNGLLLPPLVWKR